jgi:periplasmic protein TonB
VITDYHSPFVPADPGKAATNQTGAKALVVDGSWRYLGGGQSRLGLLVAIVVSLALHGGIFYGHLLIPKKPVKVVRMEEEHLIRLAIPELKELEEPEPAPNEDYVDPKDLALPVPMQADLPQLPRPNDFVQPLNFTSLIEQPDLSQSKVNIIPEHFTRATRIAESIGKIFNPEDLDRQPQPVLQPSPTYPYALRREGLNATVAVEFIVDKEGRVLEPFVIDSTHTGFNEAAVTGVSKWKFRPGTRAGAKVNVRMRVPIVFKLLDQLD